ncbi:hypothetical protein K488DRAFT_47668 [Vararia minispora EC-137]|uniref:Uncharacterized protein n=1 Tax=Vararia minispora EC-137 TaxID=1314806 RepID=A0ACB8QNV8_9AGAM|nr:hypothetical protein K488DRAFT_47668 [Vararia minispora EC-137]
MKATSLSNMGAAFQIRFDRTRDLGDIQEAIEAMHRSIELTGDKHPDKPLRLNNLGNSLRARLQANGTLDIETITEAITVMRRAVALSVGDHPNKPIYLLTLGACLLFHPSSVAHDECSSVTRRALELLPNGHPDKPGFL